MLTTASQRWQPGFVPEDKPDGYGVGRSEGTAERLLLGIDDGIAKGA